jgi:uncharacterized protein (DUF885 family)
MLFSTFDRRTLLLGGAAALAGCASAPAAPPSTEGDAEADAEFLTLVERLAERNRRTRYFLLRQFNAARLTPTGRVLYEAVLQGAQADSALAERSWGANGLPYAVTHRFGAHRRATQLEEGEDARSLARAINDETNQLEGDAARGVIAPGFVLEPTIAAVRAAASRAAELGTNWNERLADAFERQIGVLESQLANASSDAGVWRLPDGEAFYAQALQFQLGAAIDPREAHAHALDRCRELQAQADTLLRGYRLTQGSVAERLRALAADPRHIVADDAAKARAVTEMGERLARIRTLLADSIDGVATAPAEVRRLAANIEDDGRQGRRQGSVYFVDLGAPRPSWTLPSVVHHELIPGHILQAPFDRSGPPALQLRYAQGYSEGWSTYAEQLADDVGAYAEDPLGRIGYLQWMLFRNARIVADTGIHVMRWDRARAVEEMRALQGDSIAFVSIEDDVVRFCAQPGAHAAQGLAALHIADLRERTRRAAGASFSATRFHAAMLQRGPLSPPGLDQAARAAFGL